MPKCIYHHQTSSYVNKLTSFALVSGVTINTDARVPVHTVGTIATILTRAAGTLVFIYDMVNNCSSQCNANCRFNDTKLQLKFQNGN